MQPVQIKPSSGFRVRPWMALQKTPCPMQQQRAGAGRGVGVDCRLGTCLWTVVQGSWVLRLLIPGTRTRQAPKINAAETLIRVAGRTKRAPNPLKESFGI